MSDTSLFFFVSISSFFPVFWVSLGLSLFFSPLFFSFFHSLLSLSLLQLWARATPGRDSAETLRGWMERRRDEGSGFSPWRSWIGEKRERHEQKQRARECKRLGERKRLSEPSLRFVFFQRADCVSVSCVAKLKSDSAGRSRRQKELRGRLVFLYKDDNVHLAACLMPITPYCELNGQNEC